MTLPTSASTHSEHQDASGPAHGTFIELTGIHKAFGGLAVLRGIDLSVQEGEVLTILGGSGSGKSVMLKHMIGLLRPDRGSIHVEGRDATGYSERQWIDIRRRVGYVFQGSALFDSLSVRENVAYPLREHLDLKEEEIDERVAECLESVDLAGIEAKMPAELSGGMKKRVGVARAIALRPQAILYDEPTTGLDPANCRRIGNLINELQSRLRITSLVVTHEIELCLSVSDRIVLLRDGKLVIDMTPDEFRSSRDPEILEFLGEEERPAHARAPAAAEELHGES